MIMPTNPRPTLAAFPAAKLGLGPASTEFGSSFAEFDHHLRSMNDTPATPNWLDSEDSQKDGGLCPHSTDVPAKPASDLSIIVAEIPFGPSASMTGEPQDQTGSQSRQSPDNLTVASHSDLSSKAGLTDLMTSTQGNQAEFTARSQADMRAYPSLPMLSLAKLDTVLTDNQGQTASDQPRAQNGAASDAPLLMTADLGRMPQSSALDRAFLLSPSQNQLGSLVTGLTGAFADAVPHLSKSVSDAVPSEQETVSNIAKSAENLTRQSVQAQVGPAQTPFSELPISMTSVAEVSPIRTDPVGDIPPSFRSAAAVGFATPTLPANAGTGRPAGSPLQIAAHLAANSAQSDAKELVLAEAHSEGQANLPQRGPALTDPSMILYVKNIPKIVTNPAEMQIALPSDFTDHPAVTPPMVEGGTGQGLTLAVDSMANRGPVTQTSLSVEILRLVQAEPNGPVLLTLSPHDLGTLQFEVSQSDRGVHIHLSVDNAETFELLRRQADEVLSDLRQAGFTGASLSFAWGGAQHSHAAKSHGLDQPSGQPEPLKHAHTRLPAPPQGKLDLRL